MANKNIFESVGITPVQALMVGGGGFLIYSVAKKFGLVKSAESDKADNLTTNKKFEPGYTKQLRKEGKKVYLLSDATLKSVANKILNSKGFFKDSMDEFWSAIKTIHYQTQISQLNDYLSTNKGKELFSFLKTFLNNEEMAQVYDYFNSLPTGLI